jgi:hypothetical protein
MRRNLYADLGFRNPFEPTIEWFKHQQPAVWAKVLFDAGFASPRVSYLGNRYFRYARVPNIPYGMAYLMDSVFRLEMTRDDASQSEARCD